MHQTLTRFGLRTAVLENLIVVIQENNSLCGIVTGWNYILILVNLQELLMNMAMSNNFLPPFEKREILFYLRVSLKLLNKGDSDD